MGNLINYINESYDIREVYRECIGHYPSSGKIMCPNPEHIHHSNTPSAKIYGNMCKCFGQCGRTFGPYDLMKWYRPDMIEHIKTTELVPIVQHTPKARIEKVPIDRSLPISTILKTITGICL